jgi:hypothetical protein
LTQPARLEESAQSGPPQFPPLLVPAAAPHHRPLRHTQLAELRLLGTATSVDEENDILRPDAVLAKVKFKEDTMLLRCSHDTFHDIRNLRISASYRVVPRQWQQPMV